MGGRKKNLSSSLFPILSSVIKLNIFKAGKTKRNSKKNSGCHELRVREELITKGPEGTWGITTLFYIFVMLAAQLHVMFKMRRALH